MSLIDTPPIIKANDWNSAVEFSKRTRQALQQLAYLRLGYESSPIFESLVLEGLTATRLVQSSSTKELVSVSDLTSWVAGVANEIDITDDGDGTVTIGIVNPLIVGKGGTGVAALTDHSLLVGSGTAAVTVLAAATNGQLPVGSTGADPVIAALTGTANQLIVDNGAGSITLRLPQDIHAGASPTFAGGTFTGVVTGVTPTAGSHLVTKEYVDLALGARKDFFLSATGSDIGGYNYAYPQETEGVQSTIVNDGGGEAYGEGQHLIKGFITEVGEPGTTTLHEGVYTFHFHAKKGASNQRATTLKFLLYSYEEDTDEILITTSEASAELTDTEANFDVHATLADDVDILAADRLLLKVYAVVGSGAQDAVVTLYMEGTEDSYFSTNVDSGLFQNHGDVLDDLNTLGAAVSDGQFIVATGAGAFTYESTTTARTSLGIGEADTPTLAGLNLGTGELTCGSINRGADVLTLEIAGTPKLSIAATIATVASKLFIDQDSDEIALEIDSEATTDTKYALKVVTGQGAMLAEFLMGDGNAGHCYLGLLPNNAYSGTFFFGRNLTAGSTDCPVVYMVNEHASDDQAVLEILQVGSGPAILVAEGGRMVITGGVILSDAIVIPDDGYIGSVSETSAIQIEADGDLVLIGRLDLPSDITCGGHILFDVNNGSIGMIDSSPRLTFNDTDDQVENNANSVIAKHLAVAGTSIDADIGIITGELLTDTDNSIKRGISSALQVTKTAAAMTSVATGIYSSLTLDSTNTQNWSNALAGLCGIHSHVEVEASSAGTVTGAVGLLITSTFADAATVLSYSGIYIETPTVANVKVTTAYGIYIDNIDTAGTTNYAIYTNAGTVRIGGAIDCYSTIDATGAITAANYTAVNLLTACATNAGELDFTAASKKLDVEGNAVVSQDYSSDASPTFANLSIGTGELTCGSINRASGTLTLEIGGTAEISITSAKTTLGGTLFIAEQAAAEADVAGEGQIWVKDDAPNTAWFTDDAGNDHGLRMSAITETITLLQADNTAAKQAKIDTVAKYIPYGVTVTFQFEVTGTHTETAALCWDGFYGGGRINIYGNTGEAGEGSLHLTQDTFLDFTTNAVNGIYVSNLAVEAYIYDLKIQVQDSSGLAGITLLNTNNKINITGNYILGEGTTLAAYGILANTSMVANCRNNYVEDIKYGLACTLGRMFSRDNDDNGVPPLNGLYALNAGTIGKRGTQPAGSTANELAQFGGEIR